jgi:hypothetical protein
VWLKPWVGEPIGGEDLGKKEHQLFGEDGLESMMVRVASIEKTLGI